MEIAKETDLPELLESLGYQVRRIGRYHTTKEMDSLRIKNRRTWFRYSEGVGGDAITFLQQFCGKSFPEAVEYLLDYHGWARDSPAPQKSVPSKGQDRQKDEPPPPFALPLPNTDQRRVFAYLQKRGIAPQVIRGFIQAGLLYEDAQYHNCVFVGTDEQGVPRHAHKRSTNSQGKSFKVNVEGSRPQYSFHHVGQDGLLYVFEAPIDLLSFLTLYPDRWQEHSYVALCGTGGQAMHWMLEQNTRLRDVVLCLDHDEPGQTAAKRLEEELQGAGYHSGILLPVHKDWNDGLVQGQTMADLAMTMGQSM